jgi:hypothetical protein
MQSIKRGILQAFYPATYTADCLLLEATSNFLSGVPISTSVDAATAIAGAYCAVLFFDEHNPADAVIIAVYPNGSQGVPVAVANGLITFVTPAAGNSNFVVNAGASTTITLYGSGIPATAKAVLVQVVYSSTAANARLYLAPHGGNISDYLIIGNAYAAGENIYGVGILPVDSNGQVDVFASGGNCTITVITYGYVS